MSRPYNDHLDPDDQAEVEAMIADMIYEREQLGPIGTGGAEQLGIDILNAVLWNFRRDLFKPTGGKQ